MFIEIKIFIRIRIRSLNAVRAFDYFRARVARPQKEKGEFKKIFKDMLIWGIRGKAPVSWVV